MLHQGASCGRDLIQFIGIEEMVPKEHLLGQIDATVGFGKIYEILDCLYGEDNGRMSIDTAVLIKMVLIQHLYGLPSLRRTAMEVKVISAYCWFMEYRLTRETQHFLQ